MSDENVELAKRGFEAINETYRTGDLAPWERYVNEVMDTNVVLESATEETFTEGRWEGPDGVVAFVANQMDVLEEMWVRAEDYTPIDDECLVVSVSFGGRARHTGIEVELRPTHVLHRRGGKTVHWQIFLDRTEALRSLESAG